MTSWLEDREITENALLGATLRPVKVDAKLRC